MPFGLRRAAWRAAHRMIRILFVCTGNICRSPIAMHVLRSRLADEAGVEIDSAGTHPPVGHPMTPEAVILAREFGARGSDAAHHHARLVIPPIVESSDLVLGMSRRHRRAAVELAPRRLRATFTLREFARVVDSLPDTLLEAAATSETPPERFANLVRFVAQQRTAASPPGAPEHDDVVDPYGKDDETYRRCAQELIPALDAVERIVRRALGGAAPVADADAPRMRRRDR
jgi:protein-tyrosine phosphatase